MVTVPTFNFCTKCVGRPGMIHDRTPKFPGHEFLDDFTTEQSFDSQATYVGHRCIWLISHITHECLYSQALVDVRSTGAGVKCLYCSFVCSSMYSLYIVVKKLCRDIKLPHQAISQT